MCYGGALWKRREFLAALAGAGYFTSQGRASAVFPVQFRYPPTYRPALAFAEPAHDEFNGEKTVLLIPDGDSDGNAQAESTIRSNAMTTSPSGTSAPGPAKKIITAVTEDGRVNRMVLRQFNPAKLRSKTPQ